MKKILIVLLLMFSLISFGEEITIKDYIELGDNYFLDEDYSNAETVYKEALALYEENYYIIEKLGEIAEKKGENEKAISYYEILHEKEVAGKNVYYSLGNLYEKKDREKMYEYYELYLEKDNYSDYEFIFKLGDIYFKDRLYEKALTVFQKDRTEKFKNLFGVALCARFLGQYNKSIRYYKKCLDKKADFAEAYLGIALSYRQKGDFRNSASYFEDYLELKKDHQAYLALAEIYLLMNRFDQAKKTAKEGLKEFSNSKELKDLLIELYGN